MRGARGQAIRSNLRLRHCESRVQAGRSNPLFATAGFPLLSFAQTAGRCRPCSPPTPSGATNISPLWGSKANTQNVSKSKNERWCLSPSGKGQPKVASAAQGGLFTSAKRSSCSPPPLRFGSGGSRYRKVGRKCLFQLGRIMNLNTPPHPSR